MIFTSSPGRAGSGIRLVPLLLLATTALAGCHSTRREPRAPVKAPESPAACRARRDALAEFVRALPSRAVSSPTKIDVPESTLGAVPGAGALVEIGADVVVLDGVPVTEPAQAARVARVREWAEGRVAALSQASRAGKATRDAAVLYVAAAGDLDVQTLRTYLATVPDAIELRLLVRPAVPPGVTEADAREDARRLAEALLAERDFARERELSNRGYSEFARCDATTDALASVSGLGRAERWPALQAAFERALLSCDCSKLDTASLRWILSADQRAGAGSLGWIPLSFIRDERCEASMPKRSLKKLVGQMEQFDQDFSGGWQKDALAFQPVLTSDRLGVYFCDALPGETLEAKARARATVYFHVSSRSGCDAWTFEPMAPGSPFGTLRRASPASPPLAFHYRQAAEEIRVFGPMDPREKTLPTDEREWPCDDELKLESVDPKGITADKARWFYDEASCRTAPADTRASTGCFADHAAGTPTAPPTRPPGKAAPHAK